MPKRWRLYQIDVMDDGHMLTNATSPSKARYTAFLGYRELRWRCTFLEFCGIAKVRIAPPQTTDGYDYVRRNYDVFPEIGRRFRLINEGPQTGNEGVILHPARSSTSMIHIAMDGMDHTLIAHPLNIEMLP